METTLKIYTGQAARILKFMQGGCSAAQAAQAVGVTEGYVSQLCAETDFKAQIAQTLQKDFENAIETDKNYDEVEKVLTDKLKKMAPMFIGLDDILKGLKLVNGAKRKLAPAANIGAPSGQLGKSVIIILPPAIINNFIMNPNSEVIAVGDTELTTLNASSLDSLVAEYSKIEDAQIQEEIPKLDFSGREKVKENARPKDRWSNL